METLLTKENIELITFYIALIGCFTGCSGLLINLYRLYRERYCLKISFMKPECIFFPAVTTKKYSSPYQAAIHITICNKSVNPITIHDAFLYVDKKYTRFEKYTDENELRLPIEKKSSFDYDVEISIPMDRQFNTPLRLQAFDSFEGIAFIPYFPYVGDAPIKATIVLKTAKHPEHKVKIKISKHDC